MGSIAIIVGAMVGLFWVTAAAVQEINRLERENRQLRIAAKVYYATTKLLNHKEGEKQSETNKIRYIQPGMQRAKREK